MYIVYDLRGTISESSRCTRPVSRVCGGCGGKLDQASRYLAHEHCEQNAVSLLFLSGKLLTRRQCTGNSEADEW